MKIKNVAVLALIVLAFKGNSQSLLGKALKNKLNGNNNQSSQTQAKGNAPVEVADIEGDFTDEYGYSGKYYSLDTLWQKGDQFTQKRDKDYALAMKWKFVREENGNIVNKLIRYHGSEQSESYMFFLDEKTLEKAKSVIFKEDYASNGKFWLVQLEKDVYGLAKVDEYKNTILEYINTYAKDKAMLATYDKETGAAKMQQIMKKNAEIAIAAEREKWMKNETFKKMVGKIGFIDNYTKVSYNRNDIGEKPDVFTNSIELGKQSLFYRAYYNTPGSVLCAGCELNTTFEIEGVKVSRCEQRKTAAKWSRVIKQKFVDNSFFTGAPTIVSFQENIADYAFLYCLYQIKDKMKDGKSYKMKVTLTTNQDGVDKDVLAEGTITLVYKDANKAGFDKMMKWVESVINE